MNSMLKSAGLVVALLGASATLAFAAAGQTVTDLNMRSGPGTAYPVVATMPAGAEIEIGDCVGSWCAIAWSGQTGYASAPFLTAGGYGVPSEPEDGYDAPTSAEPLDRQDVEVAPPLFRSDPWSDEDDEYDEYD